MPKREQDASGLRRRAEERLARSSAEDPRAEPSPSGSADTLRLVHELQVHQVELEMQNDELRAAHAQSEAARRRYSELFEFAPIGYFHVSHQGLVTEVNFAGAQLVGTQRALVIDRPMESFVSERDTVAFRGFLARILSRVDHDTPAEVSELVVLRPEGAVHVRMTGSLLDGPPPSALLAVEDVTARRRAEDALRDEARRKDEFLATLSHELRNPLAPIRNGIFLLQRSPPGADRSTAALAVIDRQVTHLTRIVDDILDVTRIARGKVRLQRELLDLSEVVRGTTEDHRQAFEAAGVALEVERAPGACWVDADASRLAQVLGNLLGNALKFTNRGGRVSVTVRPDGASATMRVRDTGVGIAPEVAPHVFEPFQQARQTLERTQGGLGLGLAMVKGLVELHGGAVDVRSDGIGHGTEFAIRLPLARAPSEAPAPHEASLGTPRRVLVIEDNEDAATSLRDVLALSGHQVRIALDGPAGLALARDWDPEVVICDIGLPRMDGYQVARELRAEARLRGAWLVAMSGYASPADLERARDAGFDRHVAKPPTIAKLEAVFAEVPPRREGPPPGAAGRDGAPQ